MSKMRLGNVTKNDPVVAPTTPGESVKEGVRFKISPSGTAVWFRSDCRTCVQYEGTGGPSHQASSLCRSGGHPHCTCDGCY